MAEPKRATISEIKSFVSAQRWGILSTHSHSHTGYPFGSVAPYDIDGDGTIYIYVSLIAEHYRNLKALPQASFIICDPFGGSDPQAHARATLLLDFEVVSENEKERVRKAYEARFPNSASYEIAHNFLFMRGRPHGVRWIGGFGDIQWVAPEKYISAIPDPLAYESWGAISHMNEDHRSALEDFVRAYSSWDPKNFSVAMTSLDSNGFTLRLERSGDSHELRIAFESEVRESEKVRQAMIKSLQTARAKLSANN
jgi:putative heme iron utilization protein